MDEIVKNKGVRSKLTDEEKKNLSIRMTLNNPAKRPDVKQKISESQKGKPGRNTGKHWKMSEQGAINMGIGHIGLKLGPRSEEVKNKISKSLKGRYSGEQCNFWKGGISFEEYSSDWTDELRESIRQRDNYICQECGIHQDELEGWHKKLSVHHIDYVKTNLNPDNLITLCQPCHTKTNFNRDYWKEYFINNKK